jgi:hypothetical protein
MQLIVNVDRGEWSQLARGSHILMESRGPSRYQNPFDLALLESQLGFIVRLSCPVLLLKLTQAQFSHACKTHQPCFISSPEWRALFASTPTFPYHNSQPRSLTLRTQRWTTLSELPQLFIDFSNLTVNQKSPFAPPRLVGDTKLLDHLTFKTETLFETIKTWVETESDTLRPDDYPDVIAAVLDCNASMSLLTLTKMLVPLHRARSRSSSPEEENVASPSSQGLQSSVRMEDPAVIEYWKQRAIIAFEHVRRESMIACKVLEFGMEQLKLLGDKSEESNLSGDY